MKRPTLLLATAIICISATAQEKRYHRIGGMIIVKDGKGKRWKKQEGSHEQEP